MKAQPIAPDEWPQFCEEFTRQHRGWLATTSMVDEASTTGDDVDHVRREHGVVRDIPFERLRLDPNHRDLVLFLREGSLSIIQPVPAVIRIWALETESGAHAGLQIHQLNDGTMQLRFRLPTRPDETEGPVSE